MRAKARRQGSAATTAHVGGGGMHGMRSRQPGGDGAAARAPGPVLSLPEILCVADAGLVLLRLLGKALRPGTSEAAARWWQKAIPIPSRHILQLSAVQHSTAQCSGRAAGRTWKTLPQTSHTSMPSCSCRVPVKHTVHWSPASPMPPAAPQLARTAAAKAGGRLRPRRR